MRSLLIRSGYVLSLDETVGDLENADVLIVDDKIAAIGVRLHAPEAEVIAEMVHEIPARRFAKPEEIAAAITFLCGPSGAYINGINLPVDGGRTGNL